MNFKTTLDIGDRVYAKNGSTGVIAQIDGDMVTIKLNRPCGPERIDVVQNHRDDVQSNEIEPGPRVIHRCVECGIELTPRQVMSGCPYCGGF